MNRWILLIMLGCLYLDAFAQDAQLKSLVNAERSFSKASADKSTRTAFLSFFAPNSVALEQGKELNGLENAKTLEEDQSLLTWEPVFADIASSGDFGYTTGPFRYRKSRTDTTLIGSGYYSSVWQKQPDGRWKVIFDLGAGMVEKQVPALHFAQTPALPKNKWPGQAYALTELKDIDQAYSSTLNTSNKTASSTYFADHGRIHRNGFVPFIGRNAVDAYRDPAERKYTFTPLNARVATSGDMGFSYGWVEVIKKVEGADQKINARYFRIWKKEQGAWKIVLDVIA